MNAEQFSRALGKVNDNYIIESITYNKPKKKIGRLKWGALAACFGLIVTAAMAALPGILKKPGEAVQSPNPDPGPAISDNDNQTRDEPIPPPGEREIIIDWNNVAVNESAELSTDTALLYRDPALYDEELLDAEGVKAYYGRELTPAYIPDGLTGGGKAGAGRIVRKKATGEIVDDQAGQGFWADFWEDGSPKSDDDLYIPTGFTIRASRLGILHCALLPVDEAHTTDFGGIPVTLSHCSMKHGPFDPTQKAPDGLSNMPAGYYDIYVASFTLDGVEYEIEAQRLELEEVIKIAASVINMPYSENFVVGRTQGT